jgi:lipopolysaccharide export system protein LptA
MRFLVGLVAGTVMLTAAAAAVAQGTQVAFGGLKQDSSLPVEISANKLDVSQTDGTAIFSGDVVVGQGEMRLAAPKVRVEYVTEEGEKSGKVSRMVATGGVTLVNGAEAAESREAVYDVDAGTVVMTGDVILTQDANALSSDTMVVHLETGTATMDGRVRSIFKPASNKSDDKADDN